MLRKTYARPARATFVRIGLLLMMLLGGAFALGRSSQFISLGSIISASTNAQSDKVESQNLPQSVMNHNNTGLEQPTSKNKPEKLRELRAKAPFSIAALSRPGYYTVVLYSAPWCTPCKALWSEMPKTISAYSNVVAIYVDVEALYPNKENQALDGNTKFLKSMKLTQLPAAHLIGPFGQTIDYRLGYSDIKKMLTGLKKRSYQQPVIVKGLHNSPAHRPNK